MNHLSFFWLPQNDNVLMNTLKTEFAQLVEQSLQTGQITLPPISKVVLNIQKLSLNKESGVVQIAECLIDDPSLAAVVVKVANSVVFNRRGITCTDLQTAVSRLGILTVRDIVTAQSIEQLKYHTNLSEECISLLHQSASNARTLAGTMLLVTQLIKDYSPAQYEYLETKKALLTGLLADIGLFCLVNQYHIYLDRGNYLDEKLASIIFESHCSATSRLVLEHWGFDLDFIEVATNEVHKKERDEINYVDIARIANHILMFRTLDSAIEEHNVEINIAGAHAMYELSNLSSSDFNDKLSHILHQTGF